ncbi:MAG: NADP-dependent malic enzyme, partial [Phreatobacter sp.]
MDAKLEARLRDAAMDYHQQPTPGKIAVTPTKSLSNQHDLSLAYSPGVAYPCLAIRDDPGAAATLTARANLVAVISNGTAVLGLGNIGPLASKPVMEGKGCLFKKFAGIDVFDIEIDATDPDRIVEVIAALEPTFGGINLEDIKAPECFIVERRLRERMNIPVFHDDQHGTAIIVAAAVLNGLKVVGKEIGAIKVAVSGAGAAALACLNLLVELGLPRENIRVCDIKGVVYKGRIEEMDPEKTRYAQDTQARTLADIVPGADLFLGLSAGGVLKPEMLKDMAPNPLVLALANPEPEIRPEDALAVRPDAILCTGRSDYPNQVNNVLCFPFIFRGALDVGATTINEAMKIAAVNAIAALAQVETSDVVASAYGGQSLHFGRDYLIPRPFDPRLIEWVAPAVAMAAMESGVATRPLADIGTYRERMARYAYRSGASMKPVFTAAKSARKRVIYAEGEEDRVLRAAQVVVDEGLAEPVLLGRPDVIERQIEHMRLRLKAGTNCEIVNIHHDPRYPELVADYYHLARRDGVTEAMARHAMLNRPSLIASMLLRRGDVDAMLCGVVGAFQDHLQDVRAVIGPRDNVRTMAAMNMLMLPDRLIFICDTYVNHRPDASEIAEMTRLAAEEIRRFGLTPVVALLSHSSFGSSRAPEAQLMREARDILRQAVPDLLVEGEMTGDAALSKTVLDDVFPQSGLPTEA